MTGNLPELYNIFKFVIPDNDFFKTEIFNKKTK